jgi:hypothetical protein
MLVERVFVDEILASTTSDSAAVRSAVFEFGERRWVSFHRDREGQPVGPLTVLEKGKLPNIEIRRFPERKLHAEKRDPLTFSFKDRWTVGPWTVYAVVLPRNFIATHIQVLRSNRDRWEPELQVAVSNEDKLFYHTIFTSEQVFDIEATILENQKRCEEFKKSAEVVQGTRNYSELRKAIGRTAASPDFWFKLLDFGSKLLGG